MKDKKALLILIPFLLFVIIIGAFAIVETGSLTIPRRPWGTPPEI